MHVGLREIANRYGMKLSERSSYNDYFWNGSDLALNFKNEIWNEDGFVRLSKVHRHSDFSLAHEVAHFIVADPVEREFPEYGCEIGVVTHASGPFDWYDLSDKQYALQVEIQKGVLTREEQVFREMCADFLGCHICDKLGIMIENEARPEYKYNYVRSVFADVAFQAIIWLRERNLIP